MVPGFFALFVGLIFFLMNIVPTAHLDAVWRQVFGAPLPIWLGGIGLISGLSLLVIGYILAQLSPSHQLSRTLQVAILPTLLMTSLNLEFDGNLRPFFDLTPVASRMKQLQDAGISVAVFSDYRGEFDFAGRLEMAPEPVPTRIAAARWAERAPGRRDRHLFRRLAPAPAGLADVPRRGARPLGRDLAGERDRRAGFPRPQ